MADLVQSVRDLTEPAAADNAPLFADAILAVLDLHPAHNDDYHDGPDYCPVCIAEDGGTQTYPCPTVLAVAAALGCGEQT